MELRTVEIAVALHFHRQPLRERVGDGRAHAVQTAGESVLTVVEFRTGVQLGEHHLDAAYPELRVLVHGQPSAVVADAGDVAVQEFDDNGVAVTVGHLVDAVVDDLPQDVVHAFGPGRADIHTGARPDRVQPFEHFYLVGIVIVAFFLNHLSPARVVRRRALCAPHACAEYRIIE